VRRKIGPRSAKKGRGKAMITKLWIDEYIRNMQDSVKKT